MFSPSLRSREQWPQRRLWWPGALRSACAWEDLMGYEEGCLWQSAEQVCSHLGSGWQISHQLWALLLSSLARQGQPSVQAFCHGPVSTVIESARIWELSCHEPPCKIYATSYPGCSKQELWGGKISFCARGGTLGGKFMAISECLSTCNSQIYFGNIFWECLG